MIFSSSIPPLSDRIQGEKAIASTSHDDAEVTALSFSSSSFGSFLSVIEECTVVLLGLWDSPHLLHDIQHLIRALQSHCGPVRGAHRFPVKPPPCLIRPEYPGVVLAVTFATPEAAATASSFSHNNRRGDLASMVSTKAIDRRGYRRSGSWWHGLRITPIRTFRLTPEEAEDCRQTFMPVSMVLESLRQLHRLTRDNYETKREGKEMGHPNSLVSQRISSYGGAQTVSFGGRGVPTNGISSKSGETAACHLPSPHILPQSRNGWKMRGDEGHSASALSFSSSPAYYSAPPHSTTNAARPPFGVASSLNPSSLSNAGGSDMRYDAPRGILGSGGMFSMTPPTAKEMTLMLHSSDRWGVREKLWFVLCSPLSWYTSVIDWDAVEVAASSRGDAVVIDEESICAVFSADLSAPDFSSSIAAVAPDHDGPSPSLSSAVSNPASSVSTSLAQQSTSSTAETWNQESDALSSMQRQYGLHPSNSEKGGWRRGSIKGRARESFLWGKERNAIKERSAGRGGERGGRPSWLGEAWRRWMAVFLGTPLPSPRSSSSFSPSSRCIPGGTSVSPLSSRRKTLLPTVSKSSSLRWLVWMIPGWNGGQGTTFTPSSSPPSAVEWNLDATLNPKNEIPGSSTTRTGMPSATFSGSAPHSNPFGASDAYSTFSDLGRTFSTASNDGKCAEMEATTWGSASRSSFSNSTTPLVLMPFAEAPPGDAPPVPYSAPQRCREEENRGDRMSPFLSSSSSSPPVASVAARFAAYQASKKHFSSCMSRSYWSLGRKRKGKVLLSLAEPSPEVSVSTKTNFDHPCGETPLVPQDHSHCHPCEVEEEFSRSALFAPWLQRQLPKDKV